jgi:acyl carrier protein
MSTSGNSDSIFADLQSLIARTTGVPKDRIRRESQMEQDLGITGDDLVEVVDAVFEAFGVDPGDFRYVDYCSVEGLNLLSISKKTPVKPLTVGMLTQAAMDRHWASSKLDQHR